MRDFDTIRGKKPTKTDLILEYLVNRPHEVVTPKEVAEGLGFNLQTTVTVLNRLALEGAITKMDRGQFCYDEEEMKKLQVVDSEEEKISPLKIDIKTAAAIYKAIYDMASESTGEDVVGSITGLSLGDFDENAPLESIKNLVKALIDLLGEEIADDIVSIALENELTWEKVLEIRHVLVR
jgi:hypothetical protein